MAVNRYLGLPYTFQVTTVDNNGIMHIRRCTVFLTNSNLTWKPFASRLAIYISLVTNSNLLLLQAGRKTSYN